MGSAIAAISLNAETTDPVGAVVVNVPAGKSTILSCPFQKPVVYQAPVDSISGADVSFTSNLPTLTGPHYLQVLSGTDVGQIFTIDSYLNATLTLSEAPSGVTAGDQIAIRSYFTVADLGTVPEGTTITLLNPGASATNASYLFGTWSPSSDVYMAPGEGFIINTGFAFDIVFYGDVSVDDVVFRATAGGSSVVGNLDPINGSADVLSGIISSAPDGTSLTELVDGMATSYNYLFGSWTPDPSAIDTSGSKTIIVNSGFDLDIVNPAITVAE